MPKADRMLEAHTGEVLAPGEHVLAAVRALAVGAFGGRLGVVGELLTGAVMQSLLTGESVRRAHRAGFPASPRMVIGMTDRRLLVWKAGWVSHRPVRFLGDVPLERVASISVQPAVDKRRVTFTLLGSTPISVTAYRRDRPERFAENVRRPVPAAVTAARAAEESMPVPPPVIVPTAPPVPVGAAATVGAMAATPAPAFPLPPPGGPPSRPPRPPARSWAQAMPVLESESRSATAAPSADHRRCNQCGTNNSKDALFCVRCFLPFSVEALSAKVPAPVMAPAPKPQPAPTGGGPALESAVRPTLSWGALPTPIKTKGGGSGIVTKLAIAGMAVLLAFVAYEGARAYLDRYSRKHVVVPATIAGMGKIDDPRLQPYIDKLVSLAQKNDITGKAAYYGFYGDPRFYFAAFEYQKAADQSAAAIFSEFAKGYASAGRAKIDLASTTVETTNEATIICARLKGKVKGSICMWSDRDVVGFVQTVRQGIKPTHDLTAVVRFSVES